MTVHVFDDTACTLGEGPLWHPTRRQMFWFDIMGRSLLTRTADGPGSWQFDGHVSAAGWVDEDSLLIASETNLAVFDLATGITDIVCPLEADNPGTRSNDGRADPWGGFWIGTMGKALEPDAGTIYRYYQGEIRPLYQQITVPNAICFSPDRRHGYFADSAKATIWRQGLDEADGWPEGEPEIFVDLKPEGLTPDGAVVDAEGRLWNAQWGSARIACYGPDGALLETIGMPTDLTTCPAFGGETLTALFCTTATEILTAAQREAQPLAGMTFVTETAITAFPATGQAEHRVTL